MRSLVPVSAVLIALIACAVWSFRDHPVRFFHHQDAFRSRYGDWAIVAGASEGLGVAWAEELCRFRVNVLLVARRPDALKQVAQRLDHGSCRVDYWVQDLADSDLGGAFSDILRRDDRNYGFLVYNAAHSTIGPLWEVPLRNHETAIDVNIRGVLTMTHAFANYLIPKNRTGGMMIMSSLAGEIGTAYVTNYAATKAWNTAFAHGLRHELAPSGIDVLACVAGPIATPNYERVMDEAVRHRALEQRPEDVVTECLQGIGVRSSIRTGIVTKLSRFFLVRLLPLETAISIINHEFEKMRAKTKS